MRDTDGLLLATGDTTHIICGRNGKPKLLPHKYRAILMPNRAVLLANKIVAPEGSEA